ncbi:hypothetical protein J6590_005747 [Homalodisca vitripennis]|nr:hypothetical protein J6590_005747 [Homalodisca vitripennis]
MKIRMKCNYIGRFLFSDCQKEAMLATKVRVPPKPALIARVISDQYKPNLRQITYQIVLHDLTSENLTTSKE